MTFSLHRYVAVAVRSRLLLYSTTSSRLVRFCHLGEAERITSFTLSKANPQDILISTYGGILLAWNWTTGTEAKRWKYGQNLLSVSDFDSNKGDDPYGRFLAITGGPGRQRKLSLASVADPDTGDLDYKLLLEFQSSSSTVKYLPEAHCVVLHAHNKLILGQVIQKRKKAVGDRFFWREVALPETVTCMDTRCCLIDTATGESYWAVNIILGCKSGTMLIYEDLMAQLLSRERQDNPSAILSRRLHWHREAVLAVKWALDGNYILSGGHETVMVIWQLDSGHKQFLPHLSASIQNISVSSTGSEYALHLADNSIIVLSASELQPTAYFGGLSLGKSRHAGKHPKKVPAAMQLDDTAQVLLAVPADHSTNSESSRNATLLQTYDLDLHKHVGRQALTRNNITTININPTGERIQEPDVTHLQVSFDAAWLATVDEWMQPAEDAKCLDPTIDSATSLRREIFIKFWAKNKQSRSWELVTKIDCSQSTWGGPEHSVLDLRTNPQRLEFATISDTGLVTLWTPKRRQRNGIPVTDGNGTQLYTWTSSHEVNVARASSAHHLRISPTRSSLAYSGDGSVLVIASNQTALVTFVDPQGGKIRHVQAGSYPAAYSQVAFLDHYLVTLGRDLRVYNSVSGGLLWALALDTSVRGVALTTNRLDKTFAVSLKVPWIASDRKSDDKEDHRPDSERRDGQFSTKTRLLVFQAHQVQPLYMKTMDHNIEILLPLDKESGYLIIDHTQEILRLQPRGEAERAHHKRQLALLEYQQLQQVQGETEEDQDPAMKPVLALEALKQDWSASAGQGQQQNHHLEDERTDEAEPGDGFQTTHKTQASLAQVFEQSGTSKLPVRSLFERFIGAVHGDSN